MAVQAAQANETSWAELVEEFRNVRLGTISFFKNLPVEAWSRTGVASDNPFTVRAIAYIIAGHVAHHTKCCEKNVPAEQHEQVQCPLRSHLLTCMSALHPD